MTIFLGRRLVGLLLFFTLFQTSTGWWWRDWAFDRCLRPTVEYLIGWQLQAEVHLAKLDLTSNRLQLEDLRIERPGIYRIAVTGVDIRFTPGGLWHRRLETVHLLAPRVDLFGLPPSENRGETSFPERPPLEITDLTLRDGDLQVSLGGIRQELHGLSIDLQGTRQPRFAASARLGGGAGLPVALAGTGTWDRRPGLTLTRFDWDGASLLESPLQFHLDNSGARVAGKAQLPRLDRAGLERAATILALPLELPAGIDFSLQHPELAVVLDPDRLDLQLTIPAAKVRADDLPLQFSAIAVALQRQEDQWSGQGRFTLVKSIQTTFDLAFAQSRLTGHFTGIVGDFGKLAGYFDREWQERLCGGGQLQGDVSFENGKILLAGEFSGRRPTRPQPENFLLDLTSLAAQFDTEINDDEVRSQGQLLLAGRELATWSGSSKQLHVELQPVSLAELGSLTGPELVSLLPEELDRLAATADLRKTPHGRWQGQTTVRADKVKQEGIEVGDLTVGGHFRQQQQGLMLDNLQLTGRIGLTGGEGRLTLNGSGTLAGDAYRIKLAGLDLSDVEWSSADGLSGLTAGHLALEGRIFGHLTKRLLGFDLKARLGAGEVLYGPFYANLADTEARLALGGGFDLASRSLAFRPLELEIPGLASVRVEGRAAADLLDCSGSIRTGELGTAYDRYLKSTAEALAPALKDLTLAGTLETDFALRHTPDMLQLRASLQPQDLGLTLSSAGLDIQKLSGLLPLEYRRGTGDGAEPMEPLSGVLHFTSVAAGPARLEKAPLHLLSSPNRLAIREFPLWQLAGGQIRVSDLTAAIDAGEPTLTAHIRMEHIDLKQLTQELDLIPMGGTLNADLGEIHYANRTLSSAGQAVIEAFGGNTVISNIRLRDPLSRYRTLLGDIDFSNVDLYQLTRTFEFGEMNGILDGYIHHLRLFGTVPSQFDAELTTRDKGRRNISVKALNNLSILSQGGLSAALSRGIYRFIDFYRYQKIGIHCTLNNDVFRLQGTAREGSGDYLVYGGLLPPKIDIIAPGRDISFKEMLKRLSRIDRAGR